MSTTKLVLSTGDTLGGYRIIDVIGIGGMAIVYRAEQISLGREVALKVLSPKLSSDDGFRERFRREGKHIATLSHPHVVNVHDSGEADGQLYLAMQLVVGSTLADRMGSHGLSARDAVAVLTPIAAALDAAHAAGLVHRDIKPQNILLSDSGHPYLADFGVAKGTQAGGLTATGGFVGSLNYAAPEQFRGEQATAATDIYSLTAVLFQCLTGELPFPRDTDAGLLNAHVHEDPPQLSGAEPLSAVIKRGMAKDPSARYASAGELLAAAGAAVDALPEIEQTTLNALAAARDGETTQPLREAPETATTIDAVDKTEIIQPGQSGDATTADVRRAPPAPTPEPVPARRTNRRTVIVAGSALAVVVIGVVVALTAGHGGGKPRRRASGAAHPGLSAIAHPGPLKVAHNKTWVSATVEDVSASFAIRRPILLSDGTTTLAAGRLVESATTPAGLPPQLRARYGNPTSAGNTTVAHHSGRFYAWNRNGYLIAYVVGTSGYDVAVICDTQAAPGRLTACTRLAAITTLVGVTALRPGYATSVAAQITRDLEPALTVRNQRTGLSASSLVARTAPARRIANTEQGAAATISTIPVASRYASLLDSLDSSLTSEAKAFSALARAARRGDRSGYARAASAVAAASKTLAAASSTARSQGLAIAAIGSLSVPGPPAVASTPPRSTSTQVAPPASTVTPTAPAQSSSPVQQTHTTPVRKSPTRSTKPSKPVSGEQSGTA